MALYNLMNWLDVRKPTQVLRLVNHASTHVLVSIIYFALLAMSSWLSNLLETAPQSSAIYLPAGVKLAFALILPTRYWLTLWLVSRLYASYLGVFYTGQWQVDLFHGLEQELFFYTLVYMFKHSRWPATISTNQGVLALLLLATLTSAFKWFLFASAFEFTTWLQGQQLLQYQLNMTLGDLTGSLLIVPVMCLVAQRYKRNACEEEINHLHLSGALFFFAAAAVTFYTVRPDIYSLLRLSSLLPIIWFSYQYGVTGAIASALVANGLIVAEAGLTQHPNNTYISQLFILANATTSLVLGTATTELKQKNAALLSSNRRLKELLHKNEGLAAKMVSVQESERKHLSQELHDELGQNLTALTTELTVLASVSSTEVQPTVNSLKSNAHAMYESVYNLMHYLRPRELDELGLIPALQQGQFATLLKKAGIQYTTELVLTSPLKESQQIAIYRICQEALTNCIKHSNATQVHVAQHNDQHQVTLKITDNGTCSESSPHSGGYGLAFIDERATALGGHCVFSNNSGFVVEVTLPSEHSTFSGYTPA